MVLSLRGLGHQRLALLLTTELHANGSLQLGQNGLVRNTATRFIIINHLRLLADLGGQVLLGETFSLSALLDQLADVHANRVMMQLFGFSIQLGGVQVGARSLVGGRIELLGGFDCVA